MSAEGLSYHVVRVCGRVGEEGGGGGGEGDGLAMSFLGVFLC